MSDYLDVKIEPTDIKTEEIEIKEEPLDNPSTLGVKDGMETLFGETYFNFEFFDKNVEDLTQEIDGNNNIRKPYQHHEKRSKNRHYKHQLKVSTLFKTTLTVILKFTYVLHRF